MVSFYRWRVAGDVEDDRGEPASLLAEANEAMGGPLGFDVEIFCPSCKEWVRSPFSDKSAAMASAHPHEREQHLSGLCSDKCWLEYLGVRRRAGASRGLFRVDRFPSEGC